MATVLIVEPSHGGHRFLYVRYILENLPAGDDALLLTSIGANATNEYRFNLGHLNLTALEVFGGTSPTTVELADAVARACNDRAVATVLLMDADAPLRWWWWVARKRLRPLPSRPEISMLLTRYPLRSALRSGRPLLHRVVKGSAVLLGVLSGTITRVSAVAGHERTTRGLLVTQVRDPAFCRSHSRDRTDLRHRFDLPADRRLVGVFGRISVHKNVPMLVEAVRQAGRDVDLLVAGPMAPGMSEWLDGLPPEVRERIIVRPGFLEEDVMDGLLASCDVVSVALNHDRPSAVMGRALAADVPIVSAGSRVRERELHTLGGGLATDLTPAALAGAFAQLADSSENGKITGKVPLPTPEDLTMTVLGRRGPAATAVLSTRRRRRRPARR